MANIMSKKIVRVESLGDIVAYKPTEIQVLGSVYDKVPAEFQQDFELILMTANQKYEDKVATAKSNGEKPKSAQYKKESILEIIEPWLAQKCGVYSPKSCVTKVIKTTQPRIPNETEVPVVRSKSVVVDTEVNLDDLGDLFDNFDEEQLQPVAVNLNPEGADSMDMFGGDLLDADSNISIDLGDDLFSGDDFDFDSLLD